MNNKLFLILGESGNGKDTIVSELFKLKDELEKLNVKKLKSCTTRPKRKGEVQGKEYYFTNNAESTTKYKNDEILEYACYNVAVDNKPWFYYTLKEDLDLIHSSFIKIINPIGLSQIQSQVPKEQIVKIHIGCPEDIKLERLKKRGDKEEEVRRRLEADRKDFEYVTYDYNIINDGTNSIESRVVLLLHIIKKELERA